MRTLLAAAAVASLFLPSTAAAAVVNGEFDAGFDGWSLVGITRSGAAIADPTDFLSVRSDNGDAYAELTTGSSLAAVLEVGLEQVITITDDAFLLSIEGALLSQDDDPFGDPGAFRFPDALDVRIVTEGGDEISLFEINEDRAFANNIAPLVIPRTVEAADGALTSRFTADLSQFLGQSLVLRVLAVSEFDNRVSTFGIDSVALTATAAAAVPVPPAVALFAGPALLGWSRRRRGRRG